LQNPAACLVINDREGHQWKSELVRLRDDPNLRMQLSINAVEAGNRDFEPTAIRTKFQKIITQVASIS
jgi:predicted TIM-barrel fold metal-dependent hydrolase